VVRWCGGRPRGVGGSRRRALVVVVVKDVV
jgi:hypothetical protein